MPATKVVQEATTSRPDKRTRGQCNNDDAVERNIICAAEHNNQTKEGCAAETHLMVAIDNGSVGSDDGKDASAMTATMPVQCWHGHNNGKDASNRGNVLGNN
jgi:hypothetical protein